MSVCVCARMSREVPARARKLLAKPRIRRQPPDERHARRRRALHGAGSCALLPTVLFFFSRLGCFTHACVLLSTVATGGAEPLRKCCYIRSGTTSTSKLSNSLVFRPCINLSLSPSLSRSPPLNPPSLSRSREQIFVRSGGRLTELIARLVRKRGGVVLDRAEAEEAGLV